MSDTARLPIPRSKTTHWAALLDGAPPLWLALCLFYLALLALSEVVSFGAAYWAGAVAATLMISLYSARALRGGRRAGLVAVGLPAIYAFLFVILRLQDYSLLIGTAGLFVALALVMWVTRNIDWYAGERR